MAVKIKDIILIIFYALLIVVLLTGGIIRKLLEWNFLLSFI